MSGEDPCLIADIDWRVQDSHSVLRAAKFGSSPRRLIGVAIAAGS
jgi:hypothetical protein